jgi:serine/threonine-protein kinase
VDAARAGDTFVGMTDAAVLAIGEVVSDRYRIDAVLGEGGMGVVYRAEHVHLRKPHALKVLLPELSSMPEVVARFEREAVAAGNIQSPHVAAATDFGRLDDGSFFLVMEYVPGRTLRSVLEAGALEPLRALHILRGILEGLGAAHAMGIVHRDLKPENVMLIERDGDPDFVKVLDFGVAKVDGPVGAQTTGPQQPLTRAGALLGTVEYMSPEQALGQTVDARSDLYAAGVILFEMLTGRCPFDGGAVSVLRAHIMADVPELPPAVLDRVDERVAPLLRRLLAKTPENRLASATEVMAALDACIPALEPVPAPAPARSSAGARLPTAVERTVRQVLADPSSLVRPGAPRRFAIAGVAIVIAAVSIVVCSGGSDRTAPAAGAASSGSPTPPQPSTASTESNEVLDLPPPPTPPSASAARGGASSGGPVTGKPASSQGHRTGPGGIYIPPPSQWFR